MSKIVMYADQRAIQFKETLDAAKIHYTFDRKPDPYNDVLLHFNISRDYIDRAVKIKRSIVH